MIKLHHLAFAAILIAAFGVVAQPSSEIQALEFSAKLEQRLNSDIERIIGANKHVLTIQSELVTKKLQAEPQNQESSAPEISERPEAPQTVAVPVTIPAQPVPELPGLSGIPAQDTIDVPAPAAPAVEPVSSPKPKLPAPKASVAPTKPESSTEINKIAVTLLLENQVTNENAQLIKKLLIQKVDYNPLRGDTIDIIRTEFSVPVPEGTPPVEAQPLWQEYLWVAWIVAALILLLLVMLWRKARANNQTSITNAEPTTGVKALQAEQLLSQQCYEHEACRQELVKYSLSEPQKVDSVIRKLSLNEQNLPMFACVYQELGRALFTTMYPSLTAKIPSYIKYLEESPVDKEQVMAHLKSFKQLLMDSNPTTDSARKNQPFDFLENLTTNQLRWLLENESDRIQAMVISQLSPSRSSELLAAYPTERQAHLAMEIARLEALPMTAFNDVASSLAAKAQSVPDFRTLPTDGPQVLSNILDGLNISKQTELLNQLKDTSPGAYVQLKQSYFTFDDIWRAPAKVISNHIQSVPPQTLAIALSDVPEEKVCSLISECPERYITMVSSEVEMQSDVDDETRNAAKLEVVQVMRQALEEKKFKMSDLEVTA
ncbi:FliG C-terminal domain-containing protein [Vibrio nigripulchritudo]|nr:FliG C-terminal domain-containing protein [Vibrio nigripulchritudo]